MKYRRSILDLMQAVFYIADIPELRRVLPSVLNSLNPNEERVLKLRFGLNGNNPHTLREVGKKLNLSRERIRQIESWALRKLKHSNRANILKPYLRSFDEYRRQG